MNCKDCGYFWKEDCEDYAGCHYEGPEAWAPCEQEDYIEERNDYYE